MARFEYFVLRRSTSRGGDAVYYKGDTNEVVGRPGLPEVDVLNTFGSHGYELIAVETTRIGDTAYYFKRVKD